MKLIKTYSFKLREILGYLDNTTYSDFQGIFEGANFKTQISAFAGLNDSNMFNDSPAFTVSGGVYSLKADAVKVLNRFSQLYADRDVIYTDDEGNISEPAKKALMAIYNVLNSTYDRYSAILAAYSATLPGIMGKIEEEGDSETAVADMPQTDFTPGTDFASYSSALTKIKTTRKTDRDTPAERLSGLQIINNILRDWADEFRVILE